MVLIEPKDPDTPIITTEQIMQIIDEHASSAALVLLPSIQFYTGQYFEMKKITAHAHSRGLLIGWDCAHSVGNVDMKLHDWDVDFAAWCNYKYVNGGPGVIAGLFVHEKHGRVELEKANDDEGSFRPRLAGWWGGDKQTRFLMENSTSISSSLTASTIANYTAEFVPQPGAAGYQVSNPSVLDLNAVVAGLEIFNRTSMAELRKKSLHLTGYLEHLLLKYPLDASPEDKPFTIITPSNPEERGAQLSLRLQEGLLDRVLEILEEHGVVVDERKPDVIRVAPAPLYNTYSEVWEFCEIFLQACREAVKAKKS